MSDASPTTLIGLEQLEERLADPQPLCLGLLLIERPPGAEPVALDVASAMGGAAATRLRETLRPYDELQSLSENCFAIILPTMANADVLRDRIDHILRVVTAPYRLGATDHDVRALLGAAVRTPQDEPGDFLAKVIGAVEAARHNDGRAAVLL